MGTKREEVIVEQIASAVNTFSFDSSLFCESMGREHKTLQQSFMRDIVIPFIRYAASSNYNTDGRNEDTHRLAVELNKVLEQSNISIPYV